MSQKQAERLYQLLQGRRSAISQDAICYELQISVATFKRALHILREEMGVTVYPPIQGGYRIDTRDKNLIQINRQWFSPQELTALVQGYQLFELIAKNTYLNHLIEPVLNRITDTLDMNLSHEVAFLEIISPHERTNNGKHLPVLIEALQNKQQLQITYDARSSGNSTRDISPQKIIRYRENWYLLGYCHSRNALRTFATERIQHIALSTHSAYQVPPTELKVFINTVYGIFGGPKKHTAKITFMPNITPWIKDEVWHADQTLYECENGCLELTLPLGDNFAEITMELLRYAKHIKDISPAILKEQYLNDLQQGLQQITAHT